MTDTRAFTEADIRAAFECGATCALIGTLFPDDHFDAADAWLRWRQRLTDVWGPLQPNDVGQTPDSEGWWWLRPAGGTSRPVYVFDLPGQGLGVGMGNEYISVHKWPAAYWLGRVVGPQ